MIDNEIIKKIKNKYLLNIKNISLIRESPDNKVFLIKTDKEKFVLRINKRDVRSDILFETTWLNYLKKHDVPVVKIKNTADEKSFVINNQSVIVLFEFAQGEHIKIGVEKKPNLEKVKNAAYELAKIHNVSCNVNINIPRKRNILTEIDRTLEIEDKFLKFSPGGDRFIQELKFYQQWAKQNISDKYLIHNDYRPLNIFFDGNKVNAIIDFDWSCQGPAIKDLAHTLCEWSFPDGAKNHWPDVFSALLTSYNKIAKNKVKLDNNLYHWICFSALSDAATHFTDLANENIFKRIASSYMYQKFLYFKEFIK